MSYEDNKKYLEELGYQYEGQDKDVFFNKQTKLAFSREYINDNNRDRALIDAMIKKHSNHASNLTKGIYLCICNDRIEPIDMS